MSYFGVYIPPSKAGFEGNIAECAGSIAAMNIKPAPVSTNTGSDEPNPAKYEDPDYPPDSPLWLIFTKKSKALDVLRHYKEARLREFPNREQAESYVQFGFESIKSLKRFGKSKPPSKTMPLAAVIGGSFKSLDGTASNSPTANSAVPTPLATLNSSLSCILSSSPISNDSGSGGSGSGSARDAVASLNAERPPFRAPTKQELVDFRKDIESGNYKRVKRIVWDNPRFLISSGDTPTSLKEGYRYNAMHICAQGNQARVAELILKIISDRDFTHLYAGKKASEDMCAALNENLLDYYLNIPDKGRGETPLHFAVKNGHVPVVEVLISYPQCKSLPNKEGQLPKDIICHRSPHASPEVARKIKLLLTDPYYVPVLRATSNELPPHVGQPFTPNDPPNLQYRNEGFERLSVDLSISALAGPMPRDQAQSFFRRWKTPPRMGSNVHSPLSSSPYISPMKTPAKSIFNKSGGANGGHISPSGRRILFSPLANNATTSPKVAAPEQNGNHKRLEESAEESQQREEPKRSDSSDSGEEIENNNNNSKNQQPPAANWPRGVFGSNFLAKQNAMDLPTTPIRQLKPELFALHRGNHSSPFIADDASMPATPCSNISLDISLNLSGVSALNDSFRERHIKNSDIEKGLEVVGRQLARQEHLEWREYWDFLDTFVDIASAEGIAHLESYLAKKSEQAWNFAQMHYYLELESERAKASSGKSSSNGDSTQVMTPYTCVEKSLQVFAKRITKTLINNIGNRQPINDTLLSELKRLKSLIASFKDDARFLSVHFDKVHSRIAHLVGSYIANSQEFTQPMRLMLVIGLAQLQMQTERGEHIYCVCVNLRLKLDQAPDAVELPDALKTEDQCSGAWEAEQSCACQWDANLSRKTSRRKRSESLRSQLDSGGAALAAAALRGSATPGVAVVAPISKTTWRGGTNNNNNNSDDDDDDSDDDIFFFDCMESPHASVSDNDELFKTPPQSMSPVLSYELFIFGKEPTKRDLDVLNAIFHVDIDKETHAHVHAWKVAMEGFSSAEMDLFPSPKCVQKVPKTLFDGGTPKTTSSSVHGSAGASSTASSSDVLPIVMPKRLFATPKLLNAVAPRRAVPPVPPKPLRLTRAPPALPPSSSPPSTPVLPSELADVNPITQTFQTPLNKVRGLFSKYRDPTRSDLSSSSLNTSSTPLSLTERD